MVQTRINNSQLSNMQLFRSVFKVIMTDFKLFVCKNIVLENAFLDGAILVDKNGKIADLIERSKIDFYPNFKTFEVIDVSDSFLMPGIVDSHVHVNEPGRTHWEGFESATKAAAAGGITTIIDMPLNSIPPTTSLENLKVKIESARGKTHVNVAFWGGIIPGNQNDLLNLTKAGVLGFKCFMCPSGVDEFPHVEASDIKTAMEILEKTNTVMAFHAEESHGEIPISGSPQKYESFLASRPPKMEVDAIESILNLAQNYSTKVHIVHLSSADCLKSIEKAKKQGINLTVETCHHYLTLTAEEIPEKATHYKCCPPIRDSSNREKLWSALKTGLIDMVVSDHSPCTPDLKLLDSGDFLQAWGGISSLQFGLSLFWTEAHKRGFSIFDTNKYLSKATSKLAGLHNSKGKICKGFDADLIVWNPYDAFVIEENMIQHKNKVTPYLGRILLGKVVMTIVGGEIAYEAKRGFRDPVGKLIINL